MCYCLEMEQMLLLANGGVRPGLNVGPLKEREKKKQITFQVNYDVPSGHCWFTAALNLRPILLNPWHPRSCINNIAGRGGTNRGLRAASEPQFKSLMASGEWIRAGGKPTGRSTGVRSAAVAAITSRHSLYWPPPIGILLKVLHTQTSPLSGTKRPRSRDKESAEESSGARHQWPWGSLKNHATILFLFKSNHEAWTFSSMTSLAMEKCCCSRKGFY